MLALHWIKRFIQLEVASGLLLLLATIIAIWLANSAWEPYYQQLLHVSLGWQLGDRQWQQPLHWWLNDGLMSLFFLLAGLELKREICYGELNSRSKLLLPAAAALGGMIVPALIYVAINYHDAVALSGWAIPCATDIAFALGVLSLFQKRIPLSLRLFLLSLAILDDLGAILIIALFYTQELMTDYFVLSLVCLFMLYGLNRYRVKNNWLYIGLGLLLWWSLWRTGIHPTLAGVLLALAIPLDNPKNSLLVQWEEHLHPWVAFLILPLFAFFNAGVTLPALSWQLITQPVTLAIILGLVVGKQVGVMSASWLMIRLQWAKLPSDCDWLSFYGVAILSGIGFTMSLFIGSLAFAGQLASWMPAVKLGILMGSLFAGLMAYVVLLLAVRRRAALAIH